MKAIVKKSFATRSKGYNVGQEIEVSEVEAKDFANFISLISESKTEKKNDINNEPIKTEPKKKKGK